MPAGAATYTLAGETVMLLPSRALFIPSLHTVVVADLHWGKAAAFRAAHVPVPTGTTATDLARLSAVLHETHAQRLVILGDLLHARSGRHADTFDTITAWRATHADVAMELVRGNHDTHAGDPPAAWRMTCVDAPYQVGLFVGLHEPDVHDNGYVLAGHWHPHVTVRGRGRQSLRLPTFVMGPRCAVLPAFSSFTGTGMYERQRDDVLFGIVGDEVVRLEG